MISGVQMGGVQTPGGCSVAQVMLQVRWGFANGLNVGGWQGSRMSFLRVHALTTWLHDVQCLEILRGKGLHESPWRSMRHAPEGFHIPASLLREMPSPGKLEL